MIAANTDTQHRNARVSLDLVIETPENVVLTYQLAGPAIRGAAYLFDLAVRLGLILFVAFLIATPMSAIAPGTAMGLFLVLIFVITWGYYVACESWFNGKSVGKWVFKLRVIQEQGHPVTFWASMLRNLVRAADHFPLTFYGPAFISMTCSKRLQRLGDLVARTVVIEERHVRLPLNPRILDKIRPLDREEINSFVPTERTLSLIDRFLGRRNVLTHERGHALAAILANALASRLNYTGDPKQVTDYPMAFLARVHVTFIRREENDAEERPPSNRGNRREPAGVRS